MKITIRTIEVESLGDIPADVLQQIADLVQPLLAANDPPRVASKDEEKGLGEAYAHISTETAKVFHDWMASCVVVDAGAEIPNADLYASWHEYAEARGGDRFGIKGFNNAMSRVGIAMTMRNRVRIRRGLRLK